ncbi:tyrosine-type recombinase/integrase [Paenibacillus sp. YAF4_2]|uniref:tyrosine-type recombinase/integrase n=1 Tax=Paenibacillus sp. YAF4_2 TaxID=3233085 RepID=UPI003F97ABFD
MRGIKKPKEDDVKEMEVYNETEIKQLFEALSRESLQFRTIITLAVTTGMRRSEIAGLEWSKINLELRHLYITQAIPHMKVGEPVIKAPKNGKPRKIALSESVLTELRLLHAEREAELSEIPDQWASGNLLNRYELSFLNETNSKANTVKRSTDILPESAQIVYSTIVSR